MADNDFVVRIDATHDPSFCNDRLAWPTLAGGSAVLFCLIIAPFCYTQNVVDTVAFIVFIPVIVLAAYFLTAKATLIAPRQLIARFLLGWCIMLPVVWIVAGVLLSIFGNFIFVTTLVPAVIGYPFELMLWIFAFILIHGAEELGIKDQLETSQHFGALPALNVFLPLGAATSLGFGTGTSFYLTMVSRWWLERQCNCKKTPSEMLLVAVSCMVFAQLGQLLGWLFNGLTIWYFNRVERRLDGQNPEGVRLIVARGLYSGVMVFFAFHTGAYVLLVQVFAVIAFVVLLWRTNQRLRS